MNFFGRKKKSAPTPTRNEGTEARAARMTTSNSAQALQSVKSQIATLEKRIEYLEKKANAQLLEAKKASAAKNKTKAMQALKRKKLFEQEISKIHGAIMNLEQQSMMVESASTTKDIVEGMKIGKEAAASVMKQIDVDDVADLQDDIAEQMQEQEQIDEILGNPIGGAYDDEDDLLAELEDLEGQDELDGLETEIGNIHMEAHTLPSMPDAPQGKVHVPQRAAEDEDAAALAALEAEMAM